MAAGDNGGIDDEVGGHALTVTWDIDESTDFKSISSHRELRSRNYYDYGASVNHANRFGAMVQPLRSFMPRGSEILDAFARHEQWQLSQEFQLVGDTLADRLEYAVGVYYFKEQGWDRQEPQNNVLALNALASGPQSPAYALMLPAIWTWFDVRAKSESQAVYGQFTCTPATLEDRLHLTLGLRYTEDERSARKSSRSFDPEELSAYELGIKSDLLSDRLRLNAAVFHYGYDDMQVDQNIPPNIGVTRTSNAGKAKIDGAEIDLTALLMDELTLTASYGYLDADFEEFLDTQTCDGRNLFGGLTEDVSACRDVAASPKHTCSVALEYMLPGVTVGELSARVDYHWQAESAFAVRGGWAGRDAFELVGASLQWAGIPLGSGELRALLWGRNLADEEYFGHAMSFGVFQLATFGEPRSYGIDLAWEF